MTSFLQFTKKLDFVFSPARRQKILAESISKSEEELLQIPLEQWGEVDRSTFSDVQNYRRNGGKSPVALHELTPVNSACPFQRHIFLYDGPVTDLDLDAIVNAANSSLLGGGGVDGAIHAAAGPLLRRECALTPGCAVGEAVLTKGYSLPARYVIHTVGPMGEVKPELQRCYQSIFRIATVNKFRSLGICAVGTGVYGYPVAEAARVASAELRASMKTNSAPFDVVFACFAPSERGAMEAALAEIDWSGSPGDAKV